MKRQGKACAPCRGPFRTRPPLPAKAHKGQGTASDQKGSRTKGSAEPPAGKERVLLPLLPEPLTRLRMLSQRCLDSLVTWKQSSAWSGATASPCCRHHRRAPSPTSSCGGTRCSERGWCAHHSSWTARKGSALEKI